MHAARRPDPTTPVLIGRHWLFADGTKLPVVAGADDDSTPQVPEDLTAVGDDELADLDEALVAEFDRLHDSGSTDVAAYEAIAAALERVRTEGERRTTEKAEAAAKIEALRGRVHVAASDEDGDDDGGDDPGDGDAPAGDAPEGATADEGDREPALTAAAPRPPVRRAPSASATTRRAGRPAVTPAAPRITITAAADLPQISPGAAMDLTQIAEAMHAKARTLSNRSPRVPIATFHLPISADHTITDRTSAEAASEIIDAVANPQALVAAGGWCVPSENQYDLFALDGATGLLQLPTFGVTRGGVNIPSYIGLSAADGALWSWSEAQDQAVALTISDADVASGVATISFSAAHLLAVGDLIDITIGTSLDGPRTVVSVVDADTVTVSATGVPDATNGTGFARRKKGTLRIPCPTWSETRLGGYGVSITHGNLMEQAFPELTRRYVQLAMNAHAHRMSEINLAKISTSGNMDSVSITAVGTDAYGDVMSAVGLQAVDYRSQHQISANVQLEVVLPTWAQEQMRATLAMRAGVDMRAVSDAQIAAELAVRKVTPQFVEDYQPMWNGSARTAWPTSLEFLMYPAGNFAEGKSKTIDLGVQRDSALNAENDFTAAWTEEFSLVVRRGPKGRKVTVPVTTDGITACCA